MLVSGEAVVVQNSDLETDLSLNTSSLTLAGFFGSPSFSSLKLKRICFLLLQHKLPQTVGLEKAHSSAHRFCRFLRLKSRCTFYLETLGKNLLPSSFRGWQISAPSSCMIAVPSSCWLLDGTALGT